MPITSACILLENFAVTVDIGIHDFERGRPQTVLVSIEMEVDVDPGGAGDDIGQVLDYDFLRREILELADSRRFNLQETFCHAIIRITAARAAVRRVRATTRKPDAYADCESVGFSLLYERQAGGQGRVPGARGKSADGLMVKSAATCKMDR